MKQVPGFLMWVCRGKELESQEYRKSINPEAWYVAGRNRAGVLVAEEGPFQSESAAMFDAHAMTDTSGHMRECWVIENEENEPVFAIPDRDDLPEKILPDETVVRYVPADTNVDTLDQWGQRGFRWRQERCCHPGHTVTLYEADDSWNAPKSHYFSADTADGARAKAAAAIRAGLR